MLTGYRFWRNLFIHTLHLFGLAKGIEAAITIQYPEERLPYPPDLSGKAPSNHEGRWISPMHGLLPVCNCLPCRLHLHRSGRIPRQGSRKVSHAIRDRHLTMHLLRPMCRGLSLRRYPYGDRVCLRAGAHLPQGTGKTESPWSFLHDQLRHRITTQDTETGSQVPESNYIDHWV